MENMNEAVKLGIAATNNARQAGVTATAQQKIGYILEERAKIANYKKYQGEQKDALAKLALDVVTYQEVTGQALPTAPNTNQATIIKAIAATNEANQKNVETYSKGHIDCIASYDKSIAACTQRIEELNKELAKLAVDVVTEAQVVG